MIYETVVALRDDEGELLSYRVNDKYFVPLAEDNKHYQELTKLIADGTVVVTEES